LPSKSRTALNQNVRGDNDYLIARPSNLSTTFSQLGADVDNVLPVLEADGADDDVVHFDVIDNHYYVPNLTIGPMVCKALRDHGIATPIGVHLSMGSTTAVDRSAIGDYVDAGASYIAFRS